MTRSRALVALALLALVGAGVLLLHFSSFLDLDVYAWAGRTVLEPTQLYDEQHPEQLLRFTYPPFAALLFALLEPARLLTPLAWSVISLLALARSSLLVARHAAPALEGWSPRQVALLVWSLALLLEPAMETLRLGQINFLLLWLVLEALLGPARRWSGMLVGLAAAIKLTPGIFVLLLLVVGRVRDALVGGATLAATILLSLLVVPEETRTFWGGLLVQAGRAGDVEFVANQSVNGVLWRLLGEGGSRGIWLALALALVTACMLLARRYWRAGERLVAAGLAGLAGLLASPLSWNHHWIVVLPLLVGLFVLPRRPRLVRPVVAGCFVVLCARILWRLPHMDGVEFSYGPLQQVVGAAYVLAGLALLGAAAAGARRLSAEA